ncbi:MAG: hypothetical protein KF724_13775 [Phycisphaeraceae bacterium]|nr:hypothetical protein [Phycisphaeraceae bacterium]
MFGPRPAIAAQEVMLADPVPFDFFGTAVAASGQFMVSGVIARLPSLQGRVNVYRNDGDLWAPADQLGSDYFGALYGISFALDGDLLVVGAPGRAQLLTQATTMRGGVDFFRLSPLGELQPLAFVNETTANHWFGRAVAADQGWVIVSSPGRRPSPPPANPSEGRVRFFHDSGGGIVEGTFIDAPDFPVQRGFGQVVAISGPWAAASATLVHGDLPLSGVVHLMHRDEADAWSIAASLQAPFPTEGDRFGLSLAMKGDLLLVGAPAPGTDAPQSRGMVYAYRLIEGNWILEESIIAPVEDFCEGFGRSVAIGHGSIFIGADAAVSDGAGIASVFRYRPSGTGLQANWIPTARWDGTADEDFGLSLAMSGARLVIGVPGAPGARGEQGAGRVVIINPLLGDLDGNGVVDAADLAQLLGQWGATGQGNIADLDGNGVVNGADLALLLGAWNTE